MSLVIYVVIWAALALIVLGLAIYRNLLGIHEATLHVSGSSAAMGAGRTSEFKTEETIERWGEWLTIIVVAYGLVLATTYLYRVSEYGSHMMR